MEDTENSFIGTGWSFPPTFSRADNSVVMVNGETDIHESLKVLFQTGLGTRIMLPTYGSDLWPQVFKSLTTTFKTILIDYIRTAIINWETRIDVEEISIQQQDASVGYLTISLNYVIRQTNSRGNLVYPFYIGEGTIPQESI
ncbi:GPW/gp25 family protein [Aliikangiella sp. IMCC44359]|uniref:GPW/gp25 family protein n=1 Tax=Aliikangiella sp. IMCC44359 TaxID=3459125 RepID=UPI00403A8121